MVVLAQRMRKLQTRLLAIRLGSGAVILPKEVKRINMRFAPLINGGHMGPRKFWRHELVRLKYHNPSVHMAVDRTETQEGPATMAVHFADEDAGDGKERIETINMKNYNSSEILDALVKLTKAYPIEPTPEDREELAKLDEQRKKSEKDSQLSQQVRAKAKREAQLLEQARGDVAAQSA